MKRFGSLAVAAALVAVSASQAWAQLPGIPYQPVETGTGISIAADYGKPTASNSGSAYGLTGGLGLGRFGFSASVGAVKPTGASAQTSFGGRIGIKLFGGGLVPLSVGAQVGASSTKYTSIGGSVTQTVVLPALYVKISPPLFPLKPFGVAYYQTGNNGLKKEARFTVGANFNLLLGLGLHAGYDFGSSGNAWGVGAHFTFRVPGLPGVP
ncbi:MAG TPA: hypothetical protein VGI92_11320 [Gemmatimonadales bacterium]|jgi:hypothetical protein